MASDESTITNLDETVRRVTAQVYSQAPIQLSLAVPNPKSPRLWLIGHDDQTRLIGETYPETTQRKAALLEMVFKHINELELKTGQAVSVKGFDDLARITTRDLCFGDVYHTEGILEPGKVMGNFKRIPISELKELILKDALGYLSNSKNL